MNSQDAQDAQSARESVMPSMPDSARLKLAGNPATFQLLYESKDGKLCMFQDGQGHLTCVRADRLA